MTSNESISVKFLALTFGAGPSAARNRRARFSALFLGSLAMTALLAACAASPPVADAETLLKTRCVACHDPDKASAVPKTRKEWEQTLTKMIDLGAKLSNAEKEAIADYLARRSAP